MEKIKYDKYEIYEKGRLYTIVVPTVKVPMWIFECDDCYGYEFSMDGTTKTYKSLKYTMALLARFPNVIVYYPVKKPVAKPDINNKYDAVLYRKDVQLKRSVWFKLRRRIDRKHWVGTFSFGYDRKAMEEYSSQRMKDIQKRECTKEWIVGDMLFREFNREGCYLAHKYIIEGLDSMAEKLMEAEYASIGYIISRKNLKDTRKRNQEGINSQNKHDIEIEKEFFGKRYSAIKEACEKGGYIYDHTA